MKVIILVGISGSGKSTEAAKYPKGEVYNVYSADKFFMKEGEYQFDGAKLSQAHGWCLREYTAAVQTTGDSEGFIIVDNTNTTVGEIAPYAALALAYGHELELVLIHCDPKVATKRQVHGVPKERVHQQHSRLLNTFAKGDKGYYKGIVPWWPVREVGTASTTTEA
jgi:predicted kinase